jgi:diadenosine tetraphosphate (Ap4A) HIT family hydrolase
MPRVIPREQAIAEITAARGEVSCLMCALRDGALDETEPLVLERSARTTVLLPRYGVRWGHVLVVLNRHVTRFGDLDAEIWREACDQAYRAARALETALAPARCFVASLGSSGAIAPMTSPHLHLHVIPVHGPDERPSSVLTWESGVTVGDDAERAELRRVLLAAWG